MKENIVEHLNEHNIIKDSQHGFTRGRSYLTNLLEFFEKVYEMIDEGKPVDVIYLDFAKAFDKVGLPHKRQIMFTKENVVEQLKRLKADKSPGIDELAYILNSYMQ